MTDRARPSVEGEARFTRRDGYPPGSPERGRVTVRVSEGSSGRAADLPVVARLDRPTRRRAGVFRRALRHELTRIRDPRRLTMVVILGLVGGFVLACLLARGEAAGADTRAYWAAGRLWLSGGDPYHPMGPFMPYVYSPWMLPLFVPWSVLPWDVAWFVWRGATVIGLLWSVHWAYKRRPMTTAILLVLLAFPLAANLDTGNINLPLTLLLFASQFARPRLAGLLWMVATTVKWVPAVFWFVMSPRGRLWGVAWLVVALVLTALTLPQTLIQLQVLFSFQRPLRIDYLIFVWAIVPWSWRHPEAFRWLIPSTWPGAAQAGAAAARLWRLHWRRSPERTADTLRRLMRARVRAFLGLGV
ncbi:MAG: glycosyltransferase family 87 protein [Candidatus Limnocylindrales bacterium]